MWGTIANIAVQAGTSLISGVQAQKMRKDQRKSEQEASNLLKDIYGELEKNQYAAVGLPMKAFELEREALAAQGAQAVEAGRESERGAAAVAGRVYAGYSDAIRDIQTRQGQEMADLEKLSAAEDSRLRDIKAQLALDEAEGAQQASAMYDERAAQAAKNAIAGGVSLLGQAAKLPALYGTNRAAEQAAFGSLNLNADQLKSLGNINYEGFGTAEQSVTMPQMGPMNAAESAILPTAVSNFDPKSISQMTPKQYKQFVESLTLQQKQQLFGSKQFNDLYQQYLKSNKFNLNFFGL